MASDDTYDTVCIDSNDLKLLLEIPVTCLASPSKIFKSSSYMKEREFFSVKMFNIHKIWTGL